MNARYFIISLVLHIAFFAIFWIHSLCHDLFKSEEQIIPIDLTVVVTENLDGIEDEPPPMEGKVEVEEEKPKPKPEEKVEVNPKPKEKVEVKEKKVEIEEKPKPKPKPKSKPKEKSKKELLDERMKRMRESARVSNQKKVVRPQTNGKTDKKTLTDKEIQKLLNQGYKPGRTTNLAASDEQLAYSLIKAAFEAKWSKPPWTDTLKPMVVRVWFGNGGKVVRYKLDQSSGDKLADQTIISAASRVLAVPNLPAGFIEKYSSKGVPVRFTVLPQ